MMVSVGAPYGYVSRNEGRIPRGPARVDKMKEQA